MEEIHPVAGEKWGKILKMGQQARQIYLFNIFMRLNALSSDISYSWKPILSVILSLKPTSPVPSNKDHISTLILKSQTMTRYVFLGKDIHDPTRNIC